MRRPPLSTDSLREVNIVELGSAIADLGHRVTVVLGDAFLGNQPVAPAPNLSLAPVHNLMPFPFHPGLLPMTPELMSHPAVLDADVVQAGEFHQPSTFFAAQASQERHMPFVVWQETFRPMQFPGSLYQQWYEGTLGRKVRRQASRCIPRTSKARQYLRDLGVPDQAIPAWTPTGIDLTTYAPGRSSMTSADFGWKEGLPVLLLVARLHPNKGIDLALQAFAGILRTRTDIRLILRGTGPQEAELRRLVEALHLSEFVRFLPRVPRRQMVELYKLAQVVLCTSRTDLLPFALLEASACGRAIITTDVGAVRDIVVDGETGCVVRPGDPNQLRQSVETVLRDEERRLAFGRASRQRAEQWFDVRLTARRLVEVYHAVAQ